MAEIGKGTRVELVAGKDAGVVGVVFWWGESKFGDGMRAGVKGDDKETYWVDAEDLVREGSTGTEPPEVESKAPRPQLPVPFVSAPPRNGPYTEGGLDTELVRPGKYVDGLKHGRWEARTADGQLVEEIEWERGRRNGLHREFTATGQLIVEGEYRDHQPAGEWRNFHENGELKESYTYDDGGERHGPYVWNLDDGSPRARGAFWHGKRHGDWEWLQGDEYERSIRGYHHGQNHGESARWYSPGGRLEYRTRYHLGDKHGDEERYHPDGSPAFRGTWRYGFGVGEHRSWDESGSETLTRFMDGLPAELDEESGEARAPFDVSKATSKVLKAEDSYAKTLALEDFVDYAHRAAAVFHMWRGGAYEAQKDPAIWETMGFAQGLFSGEELVRFLQNATEEAPGAQLPNWPASIDRLVMKVYARDPEPIDAARDSLPEKISNGVALVQARFGRDIGDVLHGELDALVQEHVHNYGIADRIDWPVDGAVEKVPLFENYTKTPTEEFMTFISFFGGWDAWAEALKAEAIAALQNDSDVQFPTYRPVVERADEDLLRRLCESISLNGTTQDSLRNALLEWRDDDGETLTCLALGVDDSGLRKWPLTSIAVLKLHDEGEEVPDALVDEFLLGVESPTYSSRWVTDALNTIPTEFRSDPHQLAAALPLERGSGVPRVSMVHEALSHLSEDQIRRIIDRHLASKYDKLKVVPYLYFVDDADLWAQVMELVEGDDYGARPEKTWGFGEMGLKVMPLLEAALERANTNKNKSLQYAWRQAIICALTRAVVDAEEMPVEYDRHVQFDLVERDYDYSHIRPYLERLLYLLPTERAEPIIAAALDGEHWGRAIRAVATHPTESLLTRAFQTVRQRESTMEFGEQQAFEQMLKGLVNPAEWVRWFLQIGAGSGSKAALCNAVGSKTFQAIEEELDQPVKELDHIDKIVNLASEVGGGDQIYLLRRLAEQKHDDLNVIGGAAPGVDASRWPTFGEEPMAHLFTLDLQTMPWLAPKYSARAVSVFCHNPGLNEAWVAGTPQSAVLFTTEEQITGAGAAPDGIEEEPEA